MKVDPKTDSGDRLLAECRVDTFRSGGKGGQHQNKVESGVRLTHRPTGISVASRAHRSQQGNRSDALRRLREKLAELAHEDPPRIRTQVPSHERRRRTEEKKRRSRLKRLRARPRPEE